MRKTFNFTMDGEFANKVQTIKGYRKLSGEGLKEAKAFVELVEELGTVTRAVTTPEDPLDEREAIKEIRTGGIEVDDAHANDREDLIDRIKGCASEAVLANQYDIAEQLIVLLKATR